MNIGRMFRESPEEDQASLAEWLRVELCPVELSRERLVAAVVARCRNDPGTAAGAGEGQLRRAAGPRTS
ncbi:hypothetical protein ABZ468_35505 [Streptomyces sp. NPDC005708]|uniref:hypothetical protein n=1 Tax=unclassified Streptomyces TaxID=2593676 RepID=UPI0033F4E8A0